MKHDHDDLHDNDAKLADLAWGRVSLEPIIPLVDIRAEQPSRQADWMVREVWEGNWVEFFDIRIVDADAPSYVKANLSWEAVANQDVAAKKAKCHFAIEDLRGSFTPLVCSTDVHSIGNMLLTSSGWLVGWRGSGRNRSLWSWPGCV